MRRSLVIAPLALALAFGAGASVRAAAAMASAAAAHPTGRATLQLVGSFDTPGTAREVAVSGGRAYVADGTAGLRVLDATDPAALREVGAYDTPATANGVAVAGRYAYVADGKRAFCSNRGCVDNPENGLRVVDVADPTRPTEVGFLHTPGQATQVAVVGRHAYLADAAGGLRVVDVADPARPTEVGAVPGMFAYDVAVAGGHLYVGDEFTGLNVFDLTDPARPRPVATVGSSDWTPIALVVTGERAYVAGGAVGVRVVDVRAPTSPRAVGLLPAVAFTADVAAAGWYLFAAEQPYTVAAGVVLPGAVRAANACDPTHPVEVASYRTPGEATGVTVVGDLLYVADGPAGVQVLRFTAAPLPCRALLPVVPQHAGL